MFVVEEHNIFRGTGPRAINAVDLIINILQSLLINYMTELSFRLTPNAESDESNNFSDLNKNVVKYEEEDL